MPSRMQGHWASFPESRGAFAYHQLVALSPSRQAPSMHKKGEPARPTTAPWRRVEAEAAIEGILALTTSHAR